jgi:hypothetical protein
MEQQFVVECITPRYLKLYISLNLTNNFNTISENLRAGYRNLNAMQNTNYFSVRSFKSTGHIVYKM